jgi:hypothetical protein
MTGAGWGILTTTGFGGSGIFTCGIVILGGSTTGAGGGGIFGTMRGRMISGIGLGMLGAIRTVTRGRLSLIFLAARLRTTATIARSTLMVREVKTDALL